jgi:hypothetical protein
MDPERHTSSTKCIRVDIRRTGHLLEETRFTFENRGRACQAATCQNRGEYRIARRLGVSETLPVGQRLHAGLGHRNMVVDGEVDRFCQLAGTEFHEFPRGERYGRKTHDRRIPAARRDVEGVDQPAVHLIGDHDRGN